MRFGPLLALCLLSVPASGFAAQDDAATYPSRPIRMIAPSSPGGPADVVARAVSQGIADVLGAQIVIDNRAGAAGLIGAELVAAAAPDGYTLLFGFSGPLVIVPHVMEKPPYHTLKDFAPVSLAAQGPYVLLVNPNVPAASVKELVALAKAQPGKLNYASGGNGTGIHLAAELFKMTAGVNIVHVPYKGAGPGQTALLANEVSMMFNGLPPALPHVKAGRLKALAIAGEKRSPLLPDMPTLMEAGTAVVATGWYGILAPRATPRSIVSKMQAATAKACASPGVRDRLSEQGVETVGSTPEEFATWLREEWSKWQKVIKIAGIRTAQ
jgi:tripartite-type tricarboxylate transporter receptor subunit TctC